MILRACPCGCRLLLRTLNGWVSGRVSGRLLVLSVFDGLIRFSSGLRDALDVLAVRCCVDDFGKGIAASLCWGAPVRLAARGMSEGDQKGVQAGTGF